MTAPVVQVRDPLSENLPQYIQLYMEGRARRDAKAREAWALVPEGTTAGQAAQNKQLVTMLKNGFGIDPTKLAPETILKPATTQGEIGNLLAAGKRAVGGPGSEGYANLGTTYLSTVAGRPAKGVTTPRGLTAEAKGAEAAALRDAAVQQGAQAAVEDLKAQSAAAKPGTPEAEAFKTFSLAQVAEALPTEAAARSWSGTLKYMASKLGVEVASNPKNPINALLAPLGITAGDAIGAVATGIDGMLNNLIDMMAQGQGTAGRISEIWEQASANVAVDVAKAFGGRVDPTFVAAVMKGDPKASDTPVGKELIRFMATGIAENLAKRVTAGDPGAQAMLGAIPLLRIYQNDPQGQASVVNMYADVLRKAYQNAGIDLDKVMPVLKRDRSWMAQILQFMTFGGLRLFPGTVEPEKEKPGKQPAPPEQPAGLGRTGAAPQIPAPEGGAALNLSDQERQTLQALVTSLQAVLAPPKPQVP